MRFILATGPVVSITISPQFASPYVMDNVNPSTVTLVYHGGPAISYVTFYKELGASSTLIGNVTSPPYTLTVTATDVATNGLLTITAAAVSEMAQVSSVCGHGASRPGSNDFCGTASSYALCSLAPPS